MQYFPIIIFYTWLHRGFVFFKKIFWYIRTLNVFAFISRNCFLSYSYLTVFDLRWMIFLISRYLLRPSISLQFLYLLFPSIRHIISLVIRFWLGIFLFHFSIELVDINTFYFFSSFVNEYLWLYICIQSVHNAIYVLIIFSN